MTEVWIVTMNGRSEDQFFHACTTREVGKAKAETLMNDRDLATYYGADKPQFVWHDRKDYSICFTASLISFTVELSPVEAA